MGVTVEDQARDYRIGHLRRCDAAVRFPVLRTTA